MKALRPYNIKDVRTVAGILSGLAKSKLKNILTADTSGGGASESTESLEERVGMLIYDILAECWDQAEEPLFAWLASLNEMTEEEFDRADPNLLLDTIEAIAERKESRDFFSRVYSQYKKIQNTGTSITKK